MDLCGAAVGAREGRGGLRNEAGGAGRQASTGVKSGVIVWHRAQWNPFPRRSELDSFEASWSRLVSNRDPGFHWARREGSLWAVAALSSNEQSPEFLRGAKELEEG